MNRLLSKIEYTEKSKNDIGFSQKRILSKYIIFTIISSFSFGLIYAYFGKIDEVVSARGKLESIGSERIIKTPYSETIESIEIKEGDKVQINQLLLKLNSEKLIEKEKEIQAKLDSLKESLILKKEIVAKMRDLNEVGAISLIEYLSRKDDLQKIESEIKQNISKLQEINILKNQYKIKSTISGYVFDLKPSSPGYFSSAGETLLKIIPDNELEARVLIRNQDIGFVKQNMKSEVRIDTYPFSSFGFVKGKIRLVGKETFSMDQNNTITMFPVFIELEKQFLEKDSNKYYLQPGQSISVNIIVREKRIISIFTDFFDNSIDSLKGIRKN